MMNRGEVSRRKFIVQCRHAAILLSGSFFAFAGCEGKKSVPEKNQGFTSADPCADLSAIGETDLALRKKLGYTRESPIPDNHCNNCNLYLPPRKEKKCGSCMLFKGPVEPSGYCTYWAPRV